MFNLEEIKGVYAKNSSDYLLKHLKKILKANSEATHLLTTSWWAQSNRKRAKVWATELLIELVVKRDVHWTDVKKIIKRKRKDKNKEIEQLFLEVISNILGKESEHV